MKIKCDVPDGLVADTRTGELIRAVTEALRQKTDTNHVRMKFTIPDSEMTGQSLPDPLVQGSYRWERNWVPFKVQDYRLHYDSNGFSRIFVSTTEMRIMIAGVVWDVSVWPIGKRSIYKIATAWTAVEESAQV